jgi:hypothetical protein
LRFGEKDVQGGYLEWSVVVQLGVNAKILFLEESNIGVGGDCTALRIGFLQMSRCLWILNYLELNGRISADIVYILKFFNVEGEKEAYLHLDADVRDIW